MKACVFIVILFLVASPVISELTQEDLQAIRTIVKESEARTDLKLAEINTEIKIIKTEIKGVEKRLDNLHTLLIAIIGTTGVIVILATAVTYAAARLGNTYNKLQELSDLIKRNTEVTEKDLEELQAFHEATNKIIETLDEIRAEVTGTTNIHTPAD